MRLGRETIELITVISEILDVEGKDMLYHGWRVAYLCRMLAQKICPHNKEKLFLAGLVHDFGIF